MAERFRLFSWWAGAVVALGAASVLVGWWLHIARLKSLLPQLVSMKPNTAASFVALGVCLVLLNRPRSVWALRLAQALAAASLLLAGLTLLQDVGGWEFGLDQLLFADDTRATAGSHPGRMAPMTGLALGLNALALLVLPHRPAAGRKLAGGVVLLAALVMAGYLFGAESLYRVSVFASVAVHTAVLLGLLALGTVMTRAREGGMRVILSATLGGESARLLTLSIPAALAGIGAVIWLGLRAGAFDAHFGLAIGMVMGMAFAVVIGQRVARQMYTADRGRMQAQRDLMAVNQSLEDAIAQRTAALEAANATLRTHADLLEYSQSAAKVGGWELTLATGQLFWTAETYRIHETSPEEYDPTTQAGLHAFVPESRQRLTELLQAASQQGQGFALELQTHTTRGTLIDVYATCTVTLQDGKPAKLTGIFQDITAQKRSQRKLEEANRELARSNSDLEQFAYVASHDLQEPLRSVSSSVQLLKRRYAGQLDERADEFITHAVGGVQRMQAVIDDLLAYSRISTTPQVLRATDLNGALQVALANLARSIAASAAIITQDPLPTLKSSPIQLALLFQNLIGNALKFRGDQPALVHVGARQHGGHWIMSVTDQGIGMEPQYFDRVFKLFQRLHHRTEYEGTGIGLTICHKIVERHGGRIWVESKPGKGSTFYFTLPAMPPQDIG